MDIVDYYKRAKAIGTELGSRGAEIIAALYYDDEHDHPSQWVPTVQHALMNAYQTCGDMALRAKVSDLHAQMEASKDARSSWNGLAMAIAVLFVVAVFFWASR